MKTYLLSLALVSSFASGCLHRPDPHRTPTQVADDARLTRQVKVALKRSPVFKFPYIEVTTYNGVVQLSGFVNKQTQRGEAAELARQIPGLREVINNISIEDAPQRSEMATVPMYGPHR